MKKSFLFVMLLSATNIFAQDVIVKKDGTTILSKIIEVGTSEVKYKKFSSLDGPMYSISKADIMKVNYENGDSESFQNTKGGGNEVKAETKEVYTLAAGTNIPVQNTHYFKAADVDEGDIIDFKVGRDIKVKGKTVIPFGTTVKGEVYCANRSSWWGTKGKLGIRLTNILMPDGTTIPLTNGDIYVTGKNRTPLSVCLFLIAAWPCCFITGSKAVLPADYEIVAKVDAPVSFVYEDGEMVPMEKGDLGESAPLPTDNVDNNMAYSAKEKEEVKPVTQSPYNGIVNTSNRGKFMQLIKNF